MASLSSVPRRRVTAAPAGILASNSFSVSASQRRNHWVYHHFRRVAVSRWSPLSQNSSSGQPQDGRGEPSKPTCYHYGSHGEWRWAWSGWDGREDGWRAQRWAFVRRLSGGGPDGGWGDGDSKFTPRNTKDKARDRDIDSTNESAERILISDFLSPDYESRFLMWKEKEQRKLLERLRKEFEEQEKELLDRQRKEAEEKEKREWKLWKKEFKEARGFEKALREEDRMKELEKERQMRNSEHVKDGSKTVPHPVPVLHPYSRVPIYEKETVDAEETAEVRRKGVDKDAVAYREQKGQPGKGGVEEIESPLVVEAAGEGVVDPVVGLEATRAPVGVDPLNREGLSVTQATDSPAMGLPDTEKVGEEVSDVVPSELDQGAQPPSSTQIVEEKLSEVEPTSKPEEAGNSPLLVESEAESADQGLRPELIPEEPAAESAPEISAPTTEGGPVLAPPPPSPPAEEPVEAPAPSVEAAPKIEEVTPPPTPAHEVPAATPPPESITAELSQIKESLSQVTNVVSKLDSTMDYELNSILIQLRLWRREVEQLASTSGVIPSSQRKLFIEDTAEAPETAKKSQSGPMEYKILSLSPTPPHHLLTTDLNVANAATRTVGGEKDISETLSKLKMPYLFLNRIPKLKTEGWEIVSGSPEMLIFARKPIAGALPSPTEGGFDSTTAVNPTPVEPTTRTEPMNPPNEVKTVFESSSTHGFVDQETGTIVLKPKSENEKKRLMYNFNDDGHLHFYGHGLGGIAGDGVSFSGINLTPRVNPIDMTMQFEPSSHASSSSASSGEDLESGKQEVDHAWDEKRTDAVRSMREGLRLGEKAQEEARASVVEVEEDVEEKRRMAEEEARIIDEIKAVDNAVHGQAIAREAAAAAEGGLPPSQGESEQQGQQKKKGGRVGRFFKRLGWTVVWLGAGVVVVKEVGYWSQKAEEKQKAEAGGQGRMRRDGLGAQQAGEWNVVGGTGERSGAARPGSRYSWSERESMREGRWGSGGGGGIMWREER
ncbi:hypothetical protein EV426DRAFT_572683 [Tirmania nivea]|nr:hypothetical protein EV426DRAFT_572683 [Tirmania nivea]